MTPTVEKSPGPLNPWVLDVSLNPKPRARIISTRDLTTGGKESRAQGSGFALQESMPALVGEKQPGLPIVG